MKYIALTLLIVTSFTTQAMPVETDSLIFEVPNHWECNHKHIHIRCKPKGNKQKIVAVITSYPSKKNENIATLEAILSKPKSLPSVDGTTKLSKVYYTKELKVNKVTWLNSLHFGSEVPNYFTQYIATIDTSFMHLINISVQRDAYKTYLNDISTILYSLKLKYNPEKSQPNGNAVAIAKDDEDPSQSRAGVGGLPLEVLVGIGILVLALSILLLRVRKKK